MYQYKYNVEDSDGDRSVIGFNFSPETGRLSLLRNELTMMVATGSYMEIPDSRQLGRTLKKAIERAIEEDDDDPQIFSMEDFEDEKMHTLLVPVDSPWCNKGSHVNQVTHIVRGALGMALKAIIVEGANMTGKFSIKSDAPIVRSKNLAFLWDIFCYFQANKEKITRDMDEEPEEHTQLLELFENAFERPTPWDIGFWVLPVDVYEDISTMVMRVPYDVMLDLYKGNHNVNSGDYDGTRLNNNEKAIDVTEEFRKMLENRSNREN